MNSFLLVWVFISNIAVSCKNTSIPYLSKVAFFGLGSRLRTMIPCARCSSFRSKAARIKMFKYDISRTMGMKQVNNPSLLYVLRGRNRGENWQCPGGKYGHEGGQ